MKRIICLCIAAAFCITCLTACAAEENTATAAPTDPTEVISAEPLVWNSYSKVEAVPTAEGYQLLWPDARGAASYLVTIGDDKPVSTTENTYHVISDRQATVTAVDSNGEPLAELNWRVDNTMNKENTPGWFDLYSMQEDSQFHFQSNNKSVPSKVLDLDMTPYPQVKICYEAQLSSYTTGPSHYSELSDDCTSAGVKICMGDTRTLVSIEKKTLVGGVANATWGNSVPYTAGNEWHRYEVLMDNTENTYTVYVDGQPLMSGVQSARNNIANNVEFYAMGTVSDPADVKFRNVKVSCVKTDKLPIWNYASEIASVGHTDGFTLAWPSAQDAEYYLVQIGSNEPVKVTDNYYRTSGLQHEVNGYEVTVQAFSEEGGSLSVLNKTCNTTFDASKGMDLREILTGNLGGSATAPYAVYRIPGMIVTERNTLIMFYEARVTPSDNGAMDIIAFRSTDGGETFSDPIMLAEGASTLTTMNNPVMIPDGETIHFIYSVNYGICTTCGNAAKSSCENHGRGGVYYRKSTDDGITWSEPVNISDSTNPKERYLIAPGPGAGLCTDDGTLIVPVWLVQKRNGDPTNPLKQTPGDIATLYSKDGGITWQMTDVIKTSPQTVSRLEPLPVQLSDGRIMYNIRCYGGWRGVTVSDNGIDSFSTVKFDKNLIDPFCNAGFAAYALEDHPYTLLFCNCENNSSFDIASRNNMVLKGSMDDGETWNMRLVIDPGDAGYSAITVDQNGIIYVLYEVVAGKQVKLARLTYDYLIENSTPLN